MSLSFKEVAEVLKIIEASNCDELVLELEGTRLMVRRNGAGTAAAQPAAAPPATAPVPAAAGEASPAPAGASAPPAAVGEGKVAVRAPMVGTFYRAPAPEEQPFVEVGSRVAEGDPLGLVEVMKLFNTIDAPVAGRVAEIAVENAGAVELDQLLFVIEPE